MKNVRAVTGEAHKLRLAPPGEGDVGGRNDRQELDVLA
jgi:hypothetical protein